MRRRRWSSQRILGLGIVFALLVACGQQQAQTPGAPVLIPLSGPVPEASGKLLYDRTGAWWTYEPSTQQKQELVSFPEQVFPSTPALSPDGETVAFSVFSYGKGPEDPAYGTDLYLMKPDGTDQRVLLKHSAPAETFTDPAWSPDGSTIYFTRRSPTGDYQIERVLLDGSEREVVVENAQSPTLSADGQHLAYTAVDPMTQLLVIMVAGTDGGNPRSLLKDQTFQFLSAPRFAPSGSQLVFAGVPEGATIDGGKQGSGLLDWLQPRAAHAHGVPWDLWLINADGSNLRQLTNIQEDYPIAAWSPDGAWIGFKGEFGLYIVDVAGGQLRRVSEEVAASIAWLR